MSFCQTVPRRASGMPRRMCTASVARSFSSSVSLGAAAAGQGQRVGRAVATAGGQEGGGGAPVRQGAHPPGGLRRRLLLRQPREPLVLGQGARLPRRLHRPVGAGGATPPVTGGDRGRGGLAGRGRRQQEHSRAQQPTRQAYTPAQQQHDEVWGRCGVYEGMSALAVARRNASRTSTPARSCAGWRLMPSPKTPPPPPPAARPRSSQTNPKSSWAPEEFCLAGVEYEASRSLVLVGVCVGRCDPVRSPCV
eukprot:COSAG04_NODE_2231_length_4481_cov_7.647649_3_plen_250_part_00